MSAKQVKDRIIFCIAVIFVGQNIRGFRGWTPDHEYFTHKWSNLIPTLPAVQAETTTTNIADPRIFWSPKITTTVRVEIFEGGNFRAIPDFALFRKFRGY